MVFDLHSPSFSSDSDTESEGKIGFCPVFPRMVLAGPSSSASTGSDTKSGRTELRAVLLMDLSSGQIKRKIRRVLSGFSGVHTICLDTERGRCVLVGFSFDPVCVASTLRRKIGDICIVSVDCATKNTFPTTVRITELQPNEDTYLERKTSLGMQISEEQQEQSEKQQEDQSPRGQAACYISQVKASLLAHPLPSMSLPLASEARPSPSLVSPPSQRTSDQMQATPDHVSELSFSFAPSSSCTLWTGSLVYMPAHSSISGGACFAKDMEQTEEEGLEGRDQLYDSAIPHLLSGIDGVGELKRHQDIPAGEQASRLKEADDTTIMLHKQVEELKAKVSMANVTERYLMDMLHTSKERHDKTKRELAFARVKLNEANYEIEYWKAAVSRYQHGIVEAELEKEKAEERVSRAADEGENMRHLHPQGVGYSPELFSFASPSPLPPGLGGVHEKRSCS